MYNGSGYAILYMYGYFFAEQYIKSVSHQWRESELYRKLSKSD